jgi:hypothetical protein
LNNGGAVTVDFKEVVEQINQYLAQVTIEQFERDLQRAGIEQCPANVPPVILPLININRLNEIQKQ